MRFVKGGKILSRGRDFVKGGGITPPPPSEVLVLVIQTILD